MVVKKKGIVLISVIDFFSVVVINGAGVVWITGFVVGLEVVVVVVEIFVLYSLSSSLSKIKFEDFTCKGIKAKLSVSARCISESGICQAVDLIFVTDTVVGFVKVSNDLVVLAPKVVVEVCVVDLNDTVASVVDGITSVFDLIGLEVKFVDFGDVIGILVVCSTVVVGTVGKFKVTAEDVVDDFCKLSMFSTVSRISEFRVSLLYIVVGSTFLFFKTVVVAGKLVVEVVDIVDTSGLIVDGFTVVLVKFVSGFIVVVVISSFFFFLDESISSIVFGD